MQLLPAISLGTFMLFSGVAFAQRQDIIFTSLHTEGHRKAQRLQEKVRHTQFFGKIDFILAQRCVEQHLQIGDNLRFSLDNPLEPSQSTQLGQKRKHSTHSVDDLAYKELEYVRDIKSRILSCWKTSCMAYGNNQNSGWLKVSLSIDKYGHLSKTKIIDYSGVSESQKKYTLAAIHCTKLPDMPSDFKSDIGSKPFQLVLIFRFENNQEKFTYSLTCEKE